MVLRRDGRWTVGEPALFLALLLGAVVGCGDGEESPPDPEGCTQETEEARCAADEYCYVAPGATLGTCATGCRLEPDNCPAGQSCSSTHRCIAEIQPCSPGSCPTGQYCDDATTTCLPGCEDDAACDGSQCERCRDHVCEVAHVCRTDADCEGSGSPGELRRCDLEVACGECRPAECLGDGDCLDPATPACVAYRCRACADCPEPCDDAAEDPAQRCPVGYYCTAAAFCAPTCSDDFACQARLGDDYVCCTDPAVCAQRACQHRCTAEGVWACPEGQYCSQGHCLPGCADDSRCPPCEVCDAVAHQCRPGCRDDDCCPADQFCNPDAGRCQVGCRVDADCLEAAPGSVCLNHVCQARPCPGGDGDCPTGFYCAAASNTCVSGCRSLADCDEGQVCEPTTHLCLEPCVADDSCPEDQVCDAETGLCLPGCRPDVREPNDGAGAATELVVTDDAQLVTGLRLCAGEEDWFALLLEEQDLVVTVEYPAGAGDLSLTLLAADGQTVLRQQALPGQGSQQLTLGQRRAGTLFVKVAGVGLAASTGVSYTLHVQLTGGPCAPDWGEEGEGNDRWELAHSLDHGEHAGLRLCPANPDLQPPRPADEDWFSFHRTAGDAVTATLLADPAGIALRLSLWGPGDLLPELVAEATVPDGQPGVRTLQVPELAVSGTYYLQVRAADTLVAAREYSLTLTLAGASECSPDALEPNDTRLQAAPLGFPLFHSANEGLRLCAGEEDWYAVELLDEDVLRVEVLHDHAAGDLDVELYRGGAVIQRASTAGDAERLYLLVTGEYSADTYYLRVFSPTRDQNEYRLTVDVELLPDACLVDFYEPNDTTDEAFALSCGDRLEDLFACSTDSDYYEVTTYRYGALSARVDHLLVAGELDVEILDLAGQSVDTTDGGEPDGGTAKVAQTAGLPAGTYLVGVHSLGLPNRYALELGCTALDPTCTKDRLEPNDRRDIARPLVLPRVQGRLPFQAVVWDELNLCQAADHDWYTFAVKAGDYLHFQCKFFHFRDGDLELELYCGPGEVPVRQSLSEDDDEDLVYEPVADQQCWLHVFGTPLGEAGASYSLILRPFVSCLRDGDCPAEQVCDLEVLGCREP